MRLDKSPPADTVAPAKPGGIPLYVRIVIALVLGVIVGVVAQQLTASTGDGCYVEWVGGLEEPAKLIVRCLAALAPALVLVARSHPPVLVLFATLRAAELLAARVPDVRAPVAQLRS